MAERRVHLARPGRLPYAHAHEQQAALRDRARESGESWLLLLEHDPVFTLGRAHPEPKLRAAMAVIEAEGIEVVPTERGGDITYHGPGQLVAYAVLRLRDLGIGPTDLVWMLEECAIATAGEWGIEAGRDGRNRGAWVGDAKLASIGIHVRGGVSMHGMALNVRTNLEHFGLIEPCGLPEVSMTSMAALLGDTAPSVDEVAEAFARHFERVFGCELVGATLPEVPAEA